MPVETQLNLLFQVLEGGRAVGAGEVIPFPVDAGATALEGITETVELGNGVATEVSQLTAVEGGASATAGVGILGLEVGAVGAALAPALGIAAGVGLYYLAPDFWTKVSDTLMHEGETINGLVRAFINGDDKTVGFTENTIEIFKNAFIESGIYDATGWEIPEQENSVTITNGVYSGTVSAENINNASSYVVYDYVYANVSGEHKRCKLYVGENNVEVPTICIRVGDIVYTCGAVEVPSATGSLSFGFSLYTIST